MMQKRPNFVCEFHCIFFFICTHLFPLASQPDGDKEFESEERDYDDASGFRTSVLPFPLI
jgi:hypothetical protein